MSNFSDISSHYRQTASLQKSASERLFEMLEVGGHDNVLDLGCGPGNLTQKLRAMTAGKVMGIDPSPGMIAEAQSISDIEFRVGNAESLDAENEFDVIFCNSAFQWFRDPARAVANCFRALRAGGRMAIQAPARKDYCPNFIRATNALKHDARTQEAFASFHSPWIFLDTAEEYAALFINAGLEVVSSSIETTTQAHSPRKVLEMFESGAAAGYLNPEYYNVPLAPDFITTARELIAHEFAAQAQPDGLVELTFSRIYLLASKARAD